MNDAIKLLERCSELLTTINNHPNLRSCSSLELAEQIKEFLAVTEQEQTDLQAAAGGLTQTAVER